MRYLQNNSQIAYHLHDDSHMVPGTVVSHRDEVALYRTWFLLTLQSRDHPKAREVLRSLRDDVSPAYRIARDAWLKHDRKYPKWRAIPGGMGFDELPSNLDRSVKFAMEELRQAVEDWAKTYHLMFGTRPAEWIVEQAESTLHLWVGGRDVSALKGIDPFENLDEAPDWVAIDGFPRDVPPLHRPPLVRRIKIDFLYDPQRSRSQRLHDIVDREIAESDAAVKNRPELHLSSKVAQRPHETLVIGEPASVPGDEIVPTTFTVPAKVVWFVRFQVCGETMDQIAKEAGKTCKRVQQGIHQVEKLIGLTLRGPKRREK